MRSVLILTYYFPPAGGSAVQRPLKFVKYLPEFGWRPVVLTARERDYTLRDDSLSKEVSSDVPVYRAQAPDPYRFYDRLSQNTKSADLASLADTDCPTSGFKQKLALWVRGAFFIPDARVGWLPYAVKRGMDIIRCEKIQAIFATSPPFTTAVIGALLSGLTGIPWINDYRDPWSGAYFYIPRPVMSRRIEQHLERWCLRRAHGVVSINQRLFNHLETLYGENILRHKKVIIPNGFDPDDFQDVVPICEDRFTITYTGTQNARMHAGPLLDAIRILVRDEPEFREQIRVRFIGRIGEDIIPILRDDELEDIVHITGQMTRREALEYMAGADLLLLLIPDTAGSDLIVTGKLFEYLYTGRPILCLSNRGEAADIIRQTRTGLTVEPKNTESILTWLIEQLKNWQAGKVRNQPGQDAKAIEQFNRISQTEKLAALFNSLSNDSQGFL